jgi:curved DNA-binding protein CbpA
LLVRREFLGVTDHFAALGMARRPLLAEGELKDAYFRLAAEAHPDSKDGDEARFRGVREAFAVLSEPAARLRHLMELQGVEAGKSAPPLPELFMEVGSAIQVAKDVVNRRAKATQPLMKALLAKEAVGAGAKLNAAAAKVAGGLEETQAALVALDARWPEVNAGELAVLASRFTYLQKWDGELSEWSFRIAHS